MDLSLENVPKYAVKDGDLVGSFIHNVVRVTKITPAEYFEVMDS